MAEAEDGGNADDTRGADVGAVRAGDFGATVGDDDTDADDASDDSDGVARGPVDGAEATFPSAEDWTDWTDWTGARGAGTTTGGGGSGWLRRCG